jgi:hypothetical protein
LKLKFNQESHFLVSFPVVAVQGMDEGIHDLDARFENVGRFGSFAAEDVLYLE